MRQMRPELNDSATFVGILLGILLGAVFALTRIKQRGAVTRKDVTQFGAGTGELEIEASMDEAKALAKARLESSD